MREAGKAMSRKRPRGRAKEKPSGAVPGLPPEKWLYDHAMEATQQVSQRLGDELSKTPMIHFLMRHFGSLIFHAAQRLIDRKIATGLTRPKDEAVIYSCSRLFNECFSGYLLAQKGLVLQAIVLLRSAFETSTQAILFMEREDMAKRWLEGHRIQPKEVRAKSPFASGQRELYARLARLSHPNLEALRYYSAPAHGSPHVGLAYGGWFVPKAAGQIVLQFLFAQLVLLENFYTTYLGDLEQHDLVWRRETLQALGEAPPLTWSDYLAVWRRVLTELTDQYNSMPDDTLAVSKYLGDLLSSRAPN